VLCIPLSKHIQYQAKLQSYLCIL